MELVQRIACDHQPVKIKFSQDGSRLLAMGQEKIISYTLRDLTPTPAIETPLLFFDADYVNNEQIVTVGLFPERQFGLSIYDLTTQHIVAQVNSDDIRSVCVDRQRGRIFTGGFGDEIGGGEIVVYDLALNQQFTFKTPYLHMPFKFAISQSGDKLAVGGVAFGLWNVVADPHLISEECPKDDSDCTGTPCEVSLCDLTPDGRYAAAGLHGAKGVCVVLDGETGKIIAWYGPCGDEIDYYGARALSLCPDGRYVAVALDGSSDVTIFTIADGSIFHEYPSVSFGDIAFSPKGDILAMVSENSITFWSFEG